LAQRGDDEPNDYAPPAGDADQAINNF